MYLQLWCGKKIYKSFIISTLFLFDFLMNTFLDENIIYKHWTRLGRVEVHWWHEYIKKI